MRTVILISSLFLLALVSTTKSGEKEFIEATKRIPWTPIQFIKLSLKIKTFR